MIVIELEEKIDEKIQNILNTLSTRQINKVMKSFKNNKLPVGSLEYFDDVLIRVVYGLAVRQGKLTTYSSETAPGLSNIPHEFFGDLSRYRTMHEKHYDIFHLPTSKEFKKTIEGIIN